MRSNGLNPCEKTVDRVPVLLYEFPPKSGAYTITRRRFRLEIYNCVCKGGEKETPKPLNTDKRCGDKLWADKQKKN